VNNPFRHRLPLTTARDTLALDARILSGQREGQEQINKARPLWRTHAAKSYFKIENKRLTVVNLQALPGHRVSQNYQFRSNFPPVTRMSGL
jgi:hypothetical protein